MKKRIEHREKFEWKNRKNLKKLYIALVILIFAVLVYLGYFVFFAAKACKDLECFENAMLDCDKVWMIREDESAAWRYEIQGSFGNSEDDVCSVKVDLLKIKKGEIKIEDLQGDSMICKVQKGSGIFPEEDMSRCNGVLKEELQEILIQRMHNYLLENLGEIKEEFVGV